MVTLLRFLLVNVRTGTFALKPRLAYGTLSGVLSRWLVAKPIERLGVGQQSPQRAGV